MAHVTKAVTIFVLLAAFSATLDAQPLHGSRTPLLPCHRHGQHSRLPRRATHTCCQTSPESAIVRSPMVPRDSTPGISGFVQHFWHANTLPAAFRVRIEPAPLPSPPTLLPLLI